MNLQGKHALITGGGSGIGLAIAQKLAAQGAQVTITGRRKAVLQAAAGKGIFPAEMDVTDEAAQKEVIANAVKQHGPVQICVANAGIAEGRTLQKTQMELWRKIMATNLDGAFITIREAMSSMTSTDWGRVIAISSIAGLRGLKGGGAYAASKHGVIGLIRSYAAEHLGGPITFNAICPGYIRTPMQDDALQNVPGLEESYVSQSMLGRMGKAEEIGKVVRFLMSDQASFVTAEFIVVDGGVVPSQH